VREGGVGVDDAAVAGVTDADDETHLIKNVFPSKGGGA
jgi:hypothetical protein